MRPDRDPFKVAAEHLISNDIAALRNYRDIAVITDHDITVVGMISKATGFETLIKGTYSRANIGP